MDARQTRTSRCSSRRRFHPILPSALAVWAVVAFAASGFAQPASEPTVDDVLAKHVAARGGLEAIRALNSVVMTGTLTLQGLQLPVTISKQRPNKSRVELTVQGAQVLQVYDGEMAWGVNPLAGMNKPGPLPDAEAKTVLHQAAFDGPLVDPRGAGATVALVGRTSSGGAEQWELSVTYADGAVDKLYLGAEDYLERRRVTHGVENGSVVEVSVDTTAYEDVAGVKYPSKQTVTTSTVTVEYAFSSFEPNPELDPDIFLLPGQVADASLTLEQILERHAAARRSSSDQVKTLRATGTLGLLGLELPLQMTFARPRSARLEADMQGLKLILAFDGKTAWTQSPMQGILQPEALPPQAGEAIGLFADFLWGLLADVEAKGWSVSLEGIEKVERDDAYKLKLEGTDGEVRYLYLGGEDFLERKIHLEALFMGSQQVIDALLSDYSREAGVMVPRQIEILTGGTEAATVSVENVEANVALTGDPFALPPPPPTQETAPGAN